MKIPPLLDDLCLTVGIVNQASLYQCIMIEEVTFETIELCKWHESPHPPL